MSDSLVVLILRNILEPSPFIGEGL